MAQRSDVVLVLLHGLPTAAEPNAFTPLLPLIADLEQVLPAENIAPCDWTNGDAAPRLAASAVKGILGRDRRPCYGATWRTRAWRERASAGCWGATRPEAGSCTNG